MYRFGPASFICAFSTIASLATMWLAWRRRQGLGGRYLVAATLANAIWAAATAFEYAAPDVAGKLQWSQIQYLGVTTAPVLHMLFGLAYGRQKDDIKPRTLAALSVVPMITLLLAATNARHHLIWRDILIMPETNLAIYDHGPAFWAWIAYAYGSLMTGTVFFVYGLVQASSHYRAQSMLVLGAAVLPIIGNIVYLSEMGPWPGLDWTPVSFGASAALLALSIDRFRLLDLMPVIRTELLDMMSEGMLAVDEQGRIVDVNSAMSALLRHLTAVHLGQPVAEALAPIPELAQALATDGDQRITFQVTDSDGSHWYDAHVSSVELPNRNGTGHLLVLRDVTARHHLASERSALIEEFQGALAEVSTLSGLLPICPHCKKIRDDTGYWHSVEAYLTEKSHTEFTHGICPDCIKELYPELADDVIADTTS